MFGGEEQRLVVVMGIGSRDVVVKLRDLLVVGDPDMRRWFTAWPGSGHQFVCLLQFHCSVRFDAQRGAPGQRSKGLVGAHVRPTARAESSERRDVGAVAALDDAAPPIVLDRVLAAARQHIVDSADRTVWPAARTRTVPHIQPCTGQTRRARRLPWRPGIPRARCCPPPMSPRSRQWRPEMAQPLFGLLRFTGRQ